MGGSPRAGWLGAAVEAAQVVVVACTRCVRLHAETARAAPRQRAAVLRKRAWPALRNSCMRRLAAAARRHGKVLVQPRWR